MKKIGILGGMGPEATADIYMKIIKIFQTRYNAKYDSDFPQIIINSIPLPDIVEDNPNGREIEKMLIINSCILEKAGADFIIIPCNSVSKFIPSIRNSVKIPVLNIIEVAVNALKKDRIGLLATNYTIKNKLYNSLINSIGKTLILPSDKDQNRLTSIIMSILANKDIEKAKAELKKIIQNMKKRGAEEIILGCTELPIIAEKDEMLIDTLQALAEEAVALAIKETNQKLNKTRDISISEEVKNANRN